MRIVRATTGLLLCGLLAAAVAGARAGGPSPGAYMGKGKGVKVALRVNDRGEGSLRYSMRSECSAARGKVDLGAPKNGGFAGRRVSAGPHRSIRRTTVRVRAVGDGTVLSGTIAQALTATDDSKACRAKRRFRAELGATRGSSPALDGVHYAGASADGLPISFDVVGDPRSGEALVENLAADVAGDCVDLDGYDEFKSVVHLRDLVGSIDRRGDLYVELLDGDNEFVVEGQIADGAAELDVYIDGFFTPTFEPDPIAMLYCANEGAPYEAKRG